MVVSGEDVCALSDYQYLRSDLYHTMTALEFEEIKTHTVAAKSL